MKPLTTKMTDESADGSYRFTFYCDICGKPHRSPAYQSMTGGEGDERERKAEYEDAYARANREMLNKFSRCPVCQRVVCDECFDAGGDYDMCVECRQSGRHDDGDESGRRPAAQAPRLRETQNDGDSPDRAHRDESMAATMRPSRSSIYIISATCLVAALAGIWAFSAAKDNAAHSDIADSRTPLGALASQADPGDATKAPAGLPQSKAPAGLPRPDESAKPYTGAEPTMLTADGVQIPDVKNVTIPADTTDAHILLFNPADNGCSLAFTIILADSGETLYASGLVAPGMCVEDIALSKGLPKGEYKATLAVAAYAAGDPVGTTVEEVGFIIQSGSP